MEARRNCRLMAVVTIGILGAMPVIAAPMTFDVVEQRYADKPQHGINAAIFASGDIVEGTTKQLDDLVAREDIRDAVIYFDSPGGVVLESVRLGKYIRKHQFGTNVQKAVSPSGRAGKAICASACVYAYAGGVARYLDDAAGVIGVHQYYSAGTGPVTMDAKEDLKVAQLLGSVIVAHLQEMGVSSALYVAAAMTDSREMLWMNRRDATTFDLVNNGVLPPSADIRLTDDGHPYLLIRQVADRGETRVLISCDGGRFHLTGGATGDAAALRRIMAQAVRSQLEIDGRELYPSEAEGELATTADGGIATSREVSKETLDQIDRARSIGFSVDDISGRWSRAIDVSGLSEKISYYTRICTVRP